MASKVSCVGFAFLLLTLSSSVEAARVVYQSQSWCSPCSTSNNFLASREDYLSSLQAPLGNLVNSSGQFQVREHPVLFVEQLQSRPPSWLFQAIVGWQSNITNLAIRSDNLNIAGFAISGYGRNNLSSLWYSFEGQQHLIPFSTSLGFDNNYTSLLGEGGWRNLQGLPIGMMPLAEAITTLSNYDPATTSLWDIKLALATVQVMVIEAAKFGHVRDAVARAWEHGGTLDRRSAALVGNWHRISCAALIWNAGGGRRWDSVEAVELADPEEGLGIGSAEEALENVGPLLQPQDCSVQY